MGIKEIKCMKCGHIEKVYIEVYEKQGGTFSMQNTFLCNNCNSLSTINSVNQKLVCKNCRSSEISKLFPISKVKCPKCGIQKFSEIHKVKFD